MGGTELSQRTGRRRRLLREPRELDGAGEWHQEVGRDTIGIFSRSHSSECSWLVKLLTSEHFSGCVRRATSYSIANNKFGQFRDDVSQCTFGILYHTKNRGRINVTDVTSSLYDKELEYLHEKLGRDNVIVVIDDLEESTDQVKDQILKEQHSIEKWARDLFIFCQEEKNTDPRIIPSMEEKMKRLETMITVHSSFSPPTTLHFKTHNYRRLRTGSTGQHAPASPDPSRQYVPPPAVSTEQQAPAFQVPVPASLTGKCFSLPNVSKESITPFFKNVCSGQAQSTKSGFNSSKEQSTEKKTSQLIKRVHRVGIFSITSDTEHSWLKSLLGNKFRNVRSFYISFSRFHQFMDDLSHCSHGILYHTKNRGRINVTDVTDSLYDQHLKHMSDTLGKNRVIVVLDDLDDNSDKIKRSILQEQPKIRQLAQELFIVKKGTDQQKMCYFKHNRKPDFSLM